MKLRIRGNSIRLRLTQSEVEKIKALETIEEKTEFPNGQNFVYLLSVSDKLSANFSDGEMVISISERISDNWASSDEVGIYETIGNLQISIEKDFKCLTPRKGEEDSDTFPHPKENC